MRNLLEKMPLSTEGNHKIQIVIASEANATLKGFKLFDTLA
jgi:hypothetical protein